MTQRSDIIYRPVSIACWRSHAPSQQSTHIRTHTHKRLTYLCMSLSFSVWLCATRVCSSCYIPSFFCWHLRYTLCGCLPMFVYLVVWLSAWVYPWICLVSSSSIWSHASCLRLTVRPQAVISILWHWKWVYKNRPNWAKSFIFDYTGNTALWWNTSFKNFRHKREKLLHLRHCLVRCAEL